MSLKFIDYVILTEVYSGAKKWNKFQQINFLFKDKTFILGDIQIFEQIFG